jgi:cytochrome c553
MNLPVQNRQRTKQNMKKAIVLTLLLTGAVSISVLAADVKETWEKSCAKCHGPDGKGDTKLGKKAEVKDMTDAKWQADLKDDKAFKSIKEGIKDGDKVRMKPAEGLSDDDIKALVQHVHGFKK